jgi:hypothetical protein
MLNVSSLEGKDGRNFSMQSLTMSMIACFACPRLFMRNESHSRTFENAFWDQANSS